MGVQKFRRIEECPRPPRQTDPERILASLACVLSLTPDFEDIPRGVERFRSVEEANAARQQWIRARIRGIREDG